MSDRYLTITKARNGFAILHYTMEDDEETLIASNEAEVRKVVSDLLNRLYPDPEFADQFVKVEQK